MPSLMELVERVNKGEIVEAAQLEVYQESPNSAEKFLAHHAHAMLNLRTAQQHILQSLEAIDYSDQKVLNQFTGICSFLGHSDLRTGPIVRFGASAINRREYPLGIEAIQSAVAFDIASGASFVNDRENATFVASQYTRAAAGAGFTQNGRVNWNNMQTRIAVVVSSVADDEATGKFLAGLARHVDQKRFKLMVYSTEAGVRRDRQNFVPSSYLSASNKRGRETFEALAKTKTQTWIAPTDADVLQTAKDLAAQIVKDKADLVLFDANLGDAAASLVANWDVARAKLAIARRSAIISPGIDCVASFDQARYEQDKDFWQRKETESKFILEGIDTDEIASGTPNRGAYGIPDTAVVLATSGTDLDRTIGEAFVDNIINILRSHPHAIFLLVGDGELTWQKRKFESAGVGKRVGYTGRRKDLPGFLRIADIYVAESPTPTPTGVLQAMAVERPVVVASSGDNSAQSQAAAFVGSEATISSKDGSAFIERVSKLIREPAYRLKLGKAMRQRVEEHFSFAQTTRQLEQLFDQIIQRAAVDTLPAGPELAVAPLSAVA